MTPFLGAFESQSLSCYLDVTTLDYAGECDTRLHVVPGPVIYVSVCLCVLTVTL